MKWLLGGSALALVLMYAAWSVQVADLRTTHTNALKAESDKTSEQKALYDELVVASAKAVEKAANARADTLNKALDEQSRLAEENERLRGQYADAKKRSDDDSAKLTEILNNAPQMPESRLDDASRNVFRLLRQRQLAPTASDRPTPPGGGAALRVPHSPVRRALLPSGSDRARGD